MSKFFQLLFSVLASLPLSAQIFVNQVGYLPNAPKNFFVNQIADSFLVKINNTGAVVFRGELELFNTSDPATGMTLYRGDFSALNTPGQYEIMVNGVNSYAFTIAETVYDEVFKKTLKSYYFQRCGVDLLGSFADPYFRTRGHISDGFFHTSTGLTGFHDARGGWHDAGDYGKYTVPGSIAAGTLLKAYEYFPQSFANDENNIPESGNNIPDILDEVRVELDWLLKMQLSGGGVLHKLTREAFSGFVMPANDNAQRFIYQISSAATADFAALMALAARIYLPFDNTFSQQCLTAAAAAWAYLQANPTIVPSGGFQNPSGTSTGVYGDSNDRDERLWAAAELFETTGQTIYSSYFLSNYAQLGLFTSEISWPNAKSLALITYLFSNDANVNSGVQNILRNSLISYCTSLVNEGNGNGFHVAISPGNYFWGSNSIVMNRAVMLILGYKSSTNLAFRNAALDQLHYVLGANAHQMSFVTGFGAVSPQQIHHRPSAADGIEAPIPGLLAGGPNEFLQDPVLQANFNNSTPAALTYIDDLGSFASNEIAVYWNAPLVFVAGYFAGNITPTGIDDKSGLTPKSIDLFQNYPNPFNGSTTIRFRVAKTQATKLQVFNFLGQLIVSKSFGKLSPGEYEWQWTGVDKTGIPLSSGVYHYRLITADEFQSKKMLYIK